MDYVDDSDKTSLMQAIEDFDQGGIKLFLDTTINLDIQDKDGRTALWYAIINMDLDLIETLLERGANPNVKDNSGDTPLSFIVDLSTNRNYDHEILLEMAEILIKYSADMNSSDDYYQTPVSKAIEKRNLPLVKLFSEKLRTSVPLIVYGLLTPSEIQINEETIKDIIKEDDIYEIIYLSRLINGFPTDIYLLLVDLYSKIELETGLNELVRGVKINKDTFEIPYIDLIEWSKYLSDTLDLCALTSINFQSDCNLSSFTIDTNYIDTKDEIKILSDKQYSRAIGQSFNFIYDGIPMYPPFTCYLKKRINKSYLSKNLIDIYVQENKVIIIFSENLLRYYISRCKKRFISINITITFSEDLSHSTLLLIDTQLREVEYFDPSGITLSLNKRVVKGIKRLTKKLFSDYKFIDQLNFCPIGGLQSHEERHRSKKVHEFLQSREAHDGFCHVWIHLYLHLRLLNPNSDRQQIINYFLGLNKEKLSKIIMKYIQLVINFRLT